MGVAATQAAITFPSRKTDRLVRLASWATRGHGSRPVKPPKEEEAPVPPFPQSPSSTGATWTRCHHNPRRVKVEPARGPRERGEGAVAAQHTLAHGLVSS